MGMDDARVDATRREAKSRWVCSPLPVHASNGHRQCTECATATSVAAMRKAMVMGTTVSALVLSGELGSFLCCLSTCPLLLLLHAG